MDSIDTSLRTPLLYSSYISRRLGIEAYLKLENLQPSQSFKYRGISLLLKRAKATHGDDLHAMAASLGNAGIATACISNKLGIKCTIFVPVGTNPDTINRLKREGSEIVISGDCYLQAEINGQATAAANPHAVFLSSYDHPTLWEGHSSMIAEASQQLGRKPDMILCSVGGGGLLGGVMTGCKAAEWEDVPIVAVETSGSNCFYSSMTLNNDRGSFGVPDDVGITIEEDGVKIAHLKTIDSKAKSLGATSPSLTVIRMALAWGGGVRCLSIPDEITMNTACTFAEEHKMLAELACAATLTPAYEPELMGRLLEPSDKPKTVVFIVCGGLGISLGEIEEYRMMIKRDVWECGCDGEKWDITRPHPIKDECGGVRVF